MKTFKKADIIILTAAVAISAALIFLLPAVLKTGTVAVISVNNKEYGEYPLNKDVTIKLPGNTVIIKNGAVRMESADCPLGVCQAHAPITKKGESIICLPNRVIVEIG